MEVDSLLSANILRGKSKCLWVIRLEIDTIQATCELDWTVGHCYREANQVAEAAEVGERSEKGTCAWGD